MNQEKKFKVLLLMAYIDSMYEKIEEMGICYIASVLRENGCEVLLIGKNERSIDYDRILAFNPDIIGITAYSTAKDSVAKIASRLKRQLPHAYICTGGYLPSLHNEEVLQTTPSIDFIIRGEGEFTLLDLIFCLKKGKSLAEVKGLTYRENGKIISNPDRDLIKDLNTLPFPARDMLIDNKIKVATISTSRGCRARCGFCATDKIWKKWRGLTPEKIVDEMEYIVNNLTVDFFHIIDGSFEDPDPQCERLTNIAKEILHRNLFISYVAEFRADFHRKATLELMALLKKSGLIGAHVGIEAGNPFDLKLYGKIAKLEDNIKVIQLFQNWEIILDIGFININPYSTLENLETNISFLEKYNMAGCIDFIFNIYRAYKGTRLYNKIKADGLICDSEEYNSFYRYNFVNEPVNNLANFLIRFMQELINKRTIAFGNFHFADFLKILSYYKRKFGGHDVHKKAYELVEANEKEINRMRTELNQSNAQWFRKLLALVKNGWSEKEADDISENYLNGKYIHTTLARIGRKKMELYLDLLRLDGGYDKYLIDIA